MRQPRLLLLSPHFPPGQAAGALRWEKLAQLADARGWGVDALTLDPVDLPASDPARVESLPGSVRVFFVRASAPPVRRLRNALFRVYRWLRPKPSPQAAGSGAPAPVVREPTFRREEVRWALRRPRSWLRMLESLVEYGTDGAWARAAAARGRDLCDPAVHVAVVSCGPPHMTHEGARRLAEATGLPLVIDFRDPWSLVDRLPEHLASPVWLGLARRYEGRCVRRAALTVMNNEAAARAMQRLYPDRAERIVSVRNGYDEDALPREERDGTFRLAYAGSVYLDRNPRHLFRALGRLVEERGLAPDQLQIEFMGRIVGIDRERPLEEIAREEGVGGFLTLHPPGTRDEAMRFLARASMLVNLPQDSHLAIPSKIYEYMRFDAWLLALAERDSATELLLRDTDADVVDPDDVATLAEVLRRRYAEHVEGRRPEPIAREERFSRRAEAELLFRSIEAFAGAPEPRGAAAAGRPGS